MLDLWRRFWIILIIFFCFTVPVIANDTNDYYPSTTWRTSTPEAQGIDSGHLVRMLDYIQSYDINFHSIIIIRHGYIVMEAYAEPFGKNVIHTLNSCTKSVVSSLIGIALREGYIKSIDQRVVDIFSNQNIKNMDDNKRQITIEHLLTMSSGINQPDVDGHPPENYFKASKWNQYYLDLPMATQPGKLFAYDSSGVNLLMAILQKTSGMKNSDFADKFLFKPIGITNYYWRTDPQGDYLGGFGLALTPMDMARFGYLYLKKGNWNGKQIIPADWVEISMSNNIDTSMCPFAISTNKGYGFLWWGLQFGGFTAMGAGGQFIMVMPENDMVVVVTSGFPPQDFQTPLIYLAEQFTNQSYVSSSSLPENPEKQAELAAAIRNFGNPTNDTDLVIPEMAKIISGKKYILDSNPGNLKSIMVNFNGSNECIFDAEYPDNHFKIIIGLDGKYRENRYENFLYYKEFWRGKWTGENTFVAEYYRPCVDGSKIQFTFQFDQDKLKMAQESTVGEWWRHFTGKMEQ